MDFDAVFEYILVNYRWLFVCCFLLPLSVFYDAFFYFRSKVIFLLSTAPKQHEKRARDIQRQIKEWKNKNSDVGMCTGRPTWQTISFRRGKYKNNLHRISINLMDVLDINVEKRTVRCEPLVSMGQLTATLDPLGWTIPIVPELDDLTIGGLIMGTGIETSSHVHGLFQHICVSYEIALADGSVVTCSKDENPDLFFAIPWSYGTLGFLVSAEIRIIPSQRFVRLEYHPACSLDQMTKKFAEESSKTEENDFVEGIVFEQELGVVMTGKFSSFAEPNKLNRIGRWYKPWFFKHVEEKLKSPGVTVEYIPLRDYYHRHTRSIFWELQDIIPFGNNPVFRYACGWMVPPKVSLLKLTQTSAVKRLYENNHIIQDMLVPMYALKDSIRMFHREVSVYPIWLCPFKLPPEPGMLSGKSEIQEMYVDIGIYGVPKVAKFHPADTTRRIEQFVRKNRGFQMLYADSYMTKSEFREMFDHSLYDRMRKELQCTNAFPDVFDKVGRHARD